MKNALLSTLVLCILATIISCNKNKQEDSLKSTYKYYYRNLSDFPVTVTAYSRSTNQETMKFSVAVGETTQALFEFENAAEPVLGVNFNGADSVVVDYDGKKRTHIQHTNASENNPVEPGNIFLSVYYEYVKDESNNIAKYYYNFTNEDYKKAN